MYIQFFGTYLLNRGIVTQEQLMRAVERVPVTKVKIGTLALKNGLMTASQVEEVLMIQTSENKLFGQIAVNKGYLRKEDVEKLISEQTSDYYVLGQILIDDGCITTSQFEQITKDFFNENNIIELDVKRVDSKIVDALFETYSTDAGLPDTERNRIYVKNLLETLVRYIGEDFTFLSSEVITSYNPTFAVQQTIFGETQYQTTIEMDEKTAAAFTSRYVNKQRESFDDFAVAAVKDYIRLNNDIFISSASRQTKGKLTSARPEVVTDLNLLEHAILTPIIYPFGTVNLIVSF